MSLSMSLIREQFPNSTSKLKSELGVYISFNSQGHIGTDPQHWHLGESNPHRDDNLWLDAKFANLLGYRGPLQIALQYSQ